LTDGTVGGGQRDNIEPGMIIEQGYKSLTDGSGGTEHGNGDLRHGILLYLLDD
jgi:hypothetical protein